MMKRNILILVIVLLSTACNSWLDLKPEDSRVSDQYWTSKEDVQTTMLSCYTRLRECLPYLLVWGELRAENLDVNNIEATEEIGYIHAQDITSDNKMVKWDKIYRVINSANSVITYAPLVLERDPLFTEQEMKDYMAEAKGIRALAYYYLVRAFGEVPLVLEPYVSDERPFVLPKSSEQEIWKQIVEDLQVAIQAPLFYEASNVGRWQNICRLTRWGAATLLAEVYLWTGDYTKSRALCELIIASEVYELEEDWYRIFYPGRTEESIFTLYYNASSSQTNSLFNWFNPDNTNHYYNLNSNIRGEFVSTDSRGEGVTYYNNAVWKYLGRAKTEDGKTTRPADNRSSDWIVYRMADVYLIHAEACVMNVIPDYNAAVKSLNTIKRRAGITELSENDSYGQETLIQEILTERQKEFIAEGKRWFDLLRIARIENFSKYKSLVMNVMLKNVSLNERPIYQTKLSKSGSFYFPIHKDEIDMSGGVLIQNEAYQ